MKPASAAKMDANLDLIPRATLRSLPALVPLPGSNRLQATH
jgi:hypothetical protein